MCVCVCTCPHLCIFVIAHACVNLCHPGRACRMHTLWVVGVLYSQGRGRRRGELQAARDHSLGWEGSPISALNLHVTSSGSVNYPCLGNVSCDVRA